MVSLVDLLPTFLDVATQGRDIPELITPADGRSLVPLMRGRAGWRNQVVSEYTGEGVCAPCRMVRRDDVKFIYTHGHPDLMYDLGADPLELDSLIGRPEYAAIESELRGEILHDWDPEQIYDACIQSQKERLFIHKSTGGEPNYATNTGPETDNVSCAKRQRRRHQGQGTLPVRGADSVPSLKAAGLRQGPLAHGYELPLPSLDGLSRGHSVTSRRPVG